MPYLVMGTLLALPLVLLEQSLGQYTRNGPLTCWGFAPALKGIGIAMVILSAFVTLYYNVIIAWALYYLFLSLRTTLPWQNCPWNPAGAFL